MGTFGGPGNTTCRQKTFSEKKQKAYRGKNGGDIDTIPDAKETRREQDYRDTGRTGKHVLNFSPKQSETGRRQWLRV